MPMLKGYSKTTIGKNISTMEREGYPAKQAIAAAMAMARKAFSVRKRGKKIPAAIVKKNPGPHRSRSRDESRMRGPYRRSSPGEIRNRFKPPVVKSSLHMVVAFRPSGPGKLYYWDGAALRAGEHARAVLYPTQAIAAVAARHVAAALATRHVRLSVAVVQHLSAVDVRRALLHQLRAEARGVRARNPADRSRGAKLKRAAQLYSDFTGMPPGRIEKVDVKTVDVGVKIGSLDAIAYTTKRNGKTESYAHEFSRAARPLLGVSYDGQTILTAGGRFRFTDRGFVDR